MHDGYGYGFGDVSCDCCRIERVDPEYDYQVAGYLDDEDELLLCAQCTIEALVWANHMQRDVSYEEQAREITIRKKSATVIHLDFESSRLMAEEKDKESE